MQAVHIYDESSSLLFLNDGNEIKLDFDFMRFSSSFEAQKELQSWARSNGVIQQQDEIAILV